MKFFAIICLFLCFCSGFTAFTVFITLYLRFRLTELKRYIFFLAAITALIFTIIFNFYYKSVFNFPRTLHYDYFFFIALILGVSFYVLTLPHLTYSLVQKTFFRKNHLKAIALSPTALFLLLFTVNLFLKTRINDLKFSIYFATVILIFMIIHVVIFIIYNLKTVEDPYRKKLLIFIAVFLICYSPFGLMDAFYDEFFFIFSHLPDGFSFSAPYYFIWNIITLVFLAYYFINISGTELNTVTIKKLKITEREKEVAELIIKGLSNNDIMNKIEVSGSTVKKHIYNLFQKTGAANRSELINILTVK